MRPDDWQRVSTLLDQLLDLTDVEQARRLDELRRDDPSLCAEVESLLGQAPIHLLDTPPMPLFAALPATEPAADGANPLGLDTEPTGSAGTLTLPHHAGRYAVEGEIARGGMGAILRVLDPAFNRVLAVKVLLPPVRLDADAQRRFLQEAKITGRLQHPGIPPIHEIGRLQDGSPFFAMKLIEGKTLATLIIDAGTNRGDTWFLGIFEQICRTLAYAHRQGILHRDLKPSNVMVGAFGEVQVMDWGLARPVAARATRSGAAPLPPSVGDTDFDSHSRAGDVMGTPAYMAPEQARGEIDQLDERCDVFGLGGVLCAMLIGRPPFVGPVAGMVHQASQGDLTGVFEQLDRCGADAELVRIAKKCLAPKPADRFRDGAELADAVTRFRESVQERLRQADLAREKAQVQAVEERRRRRVSLTLAASLLILVLGACAAGLWYQQFLIQRQTRARNLNEQVTRSLADGEAERGRLVDRLTRPETVHVLLSDPRPWHASLSSAQSHAVQARKLADSDPSLLDPELNGRLSQLEDALKTDWIEHEFARDFDRIRMQAFESAPLFTGVLVKGRKSEFDLRSEEYARLFQARNWNLEAAETEPLPGRWRQSNVRFVIATALDDWANACMRKRPPDEVLGKRLLQLARELDPDPWRDRFRGWDVWSEPARLQTLLAELQLDQQPPQSLRAAADLQVRHRQNPVPLLRRAVRRHPSDFWLNYQLGYAAEARKDYEESIAAFRAAIAIRPESFPALSTLGWIMGMKKDYEAAEAFLNQAIRHNPDYSVAHANLGKFRLDRGQPADAIPHLRTALAKDPTLVNAHGNLGIAYFLLGDPKTALVHLDAGLQLNTNYYNFHFNRGVVLRSMGRLEEAVQAMKTSHAIKPNAELERIIPVWERLVDLQKRETHPPVSLAALQKGVVGQLSADLPFDAVTATKNSFRASHLVELIAGKSYQIDLTGDFDPYLRVEDNRYKPLVHNDDQRSYPKRVFDSRIVFTPAADGPYRLVVTSYKPKVTGSYSLRLAEVMPHGAPIVHHGAFTQKDKPGTNGKHFKRYPVELLADQPCTVILKSDDFDTTVGLLDATGMKYLGSNAALSHENLQVSRVDVTPAENGTYFIHVTTARPGALGAFTVRLQRYSPIIPPGP